MLELIGWVWNIVFCKIQIQKLTNELPIDKSELVLVLLTCCKPSLCLMLLNIQIHQAFGINFSLSSSSTSWVCKRQIPWSALAWTIPRQWQAARHTHHPPCATHYRQITTTHHMMPPPLPPTMNYHIRYLPPPTNHHMLCTHYSQITTTNHIMPPTMD